MTTSLWQLIKGVPVYFCFENVCLTSNVVNFDKYKPHEQQALWGPQ